MYSNHSSDRDAGTEQAEMSTTERELADDAQWKIIQKNTFTRWCNEHLKTVNKALADLESDFSDGLRLISLIEVLSGKKFKHVNKRPNFRTQKLENVTMTLEFLENDEGIKIVNIDSTDIVDKKLKLILGLIWTLILHYSISMPMWEGEEPTPSEGGPTPKQRLLNWIQSKVPDMPIKNFTTDWNDGRAIGALVDACGPGLCPDWEDWDPKKNKDNATEAMDAAEKWLDVPQLIKPEEMTYPKVDELSMMTYLSQFPNAKLKPGAPLRPRVNPARVRAYGPGLEPKGNQVGAPARFTIDTFSAGKGEVQVVIVNPKGVKEQCEVVFNNDRNLTYSCVYVPTMEGHYKVTILFSTREIAKSPFTVTVEGAAGDASKVTAKGPGIEKTGVVATKKTYFEVDIKGAGTGKVDVVILDPHGRKDTVRPKIQALDGKDTNFRVEYVAIDQGLHSVNVFFAGSQIPNSPFGVQVEPASNAKACYATGRGVQPRGVRVKDKAVFYVHTKGAGDGEVAVQIIGPGGVEEKCQIRKVPDQPEVWECTYHPSAQGNYIINVTFGEQHISKSPFKIEVGPVWNSNIVAYGPGLEGGVVDQPAVFTVETNGETGALGFSIEGPSQAKIDCKDNGDGSADVTYYPTKPGEYAVHILCNDQDIAKSPFMADIKPPADFDAKKVVAKGPGLEKTGVLPNKWADFTVDTSAAGKAELKIACMDVDYKAVEVQVKDNHNGTYSCRYMPTANAKHTVSVTFGGVAVPNSPFRVYVAEPSDPTKVRVHGPGVSKGVKMMSSTYFIVDCKKAGPGDVAVGLTDQRGMDVPVKTIENQDGTFTVEYDPKTPGTYTVVVYFADQEIPESPIKVNIEPTIDVSGIKVKGLDSKLPVGQECQASILLPNDLAEAPVRVAVTAPSGLTTDVAVDSLEASRVAPIRLQELGQHLINVTCHGVPLQDCPYKVDAVFDAERPLVRAHGPGLTSGEVWKPVEFIVDSCEENTPGNLGVTVQGPREHQPEIHITDNGNGTSLVSYIPEIPGEYAVNVTHADRPIQGSPFAAHIVPCTDQTAPKVMAYGPGLTRGCVNTPAKFTLDTREETQPGGLGIAIEAPVECQPKVKDNADGTCEVTYLPEVPGQYKVNVTHGDRLIPGSPFVAEIMPSEERMLAEEAPLVRAYGPGLTESVANVPAVFTIDTKEETQPGALGVAIQGPADCQPSIVDNGDGTYNVTYLPELPGEYKVMVTHADRPIAGCPFVASIKPVDEAMVATKVPRVKAYGPGLDESVVNVPAVFTVDMKEEEQPGDLSVAIEGPMRCQPTVRDNGDDTCEVTYLPEVPGEYKVSVMLADQPISGSPFLTKIVPADETQASRVKASGPGLTEGQALVPAVFTLDTRETTIPQKLSVEVEGPRESPVVYSDNQDGTVKVTYTPQAPGEHKIKVAYGDHSITGSPFTAVIKPSEYAADVSPIMATGYGLVPAGCTLPSEEVYLDAPSQFVVDASAVDPKGKGRLQAILMTPSGRRIQTLVDDSMKDGTYPVLYTPTEEGPQQLDVTYEDIPIPGSPFQLKAVPGNDASRVKAYGPGLDGGFTNEPAVFTVDMKGAGKGSLGLGIEGPVEAKMNCNDNRDGTCEVEYMPTKAGIYDVTVTFAEKPIPNSPFRVKINNPVDARKVKCYGPGLEANQVTAGVPATFTVDARDAGEAPLDVTYTDQTGKKRPAELVPVEEGVFQASYVPSAEGKCKLDVKYGGDDVPNSPFHTHALPGVDASKLKVDGPGLERTTLASLPAQFAVDARDTGNAELTCEVQRPDGTFIRPYVVDNGDGTYDVLYTPEDLGVYDIFVKYDGKNAPGSPFQVKAIPTGDASKCKIIDGAHEKIPINEETVITVDASDAGRGQVTCRVRSPSGSDIDIDIIDRGDGTFTITFTPQQPGDYDIEIKFGGNTIPNGAYTAKAVPREEYEEYLQQQTVEEDLIRPDQLDRLQSAAPGSGLYQPVDFCFQVGPIFNFVSAYVVMPSGKTAYPKIEDNRDGTVTVRYQPTETGLHELHVKYNNESIDGSPFLFHVDAVNCGYVTAYGPGLSHGTVYEPAVFTINTKEAGAGGLALAVEGPSKTEIKCVDNQDGTCSVSYLPSAAGEYNIFVKFADKNIIGSPFTAKIIPGEPRKRAQLSVGSSSEVSLKVTETDIADLTASIRSPSGHEDNCLLKRLANGHLGITFTPRETGEHLVNVFRNGKHITNSPFKIMVGESELGNASKVKVSGKGVSEGMANEVNEFVVDTREAGYGGMSLSIEGPSKADIECHDNEDGTCRVTYKPTEPGTYIINIKFADQHVPGSPFSVKIGGEPSAKITERITRHKAAADVTHVGSQCELSLKIPGTSPFDMTASVKSPSGLTELCDVVSLDDNHYSIKFVPKEMGVHTVSVKHRDMHIPGSPFQFTVGPIAGGGSHKVHAAGQGLERGEVQQPCEFNIYTREAGAGGLSIAVEGPSKAEIDFEDRKDGSCGVTYIVTEPGEYYVSIKFNDEHIPESPFRVPVTPSIGDARKISVSALQEKGLPVNKPAAFVVNFNGARGKLTAHVISPSGAQEDALVQEVDDGEYAIRFIPRENGLHLVHVLLDKYHIPDSPFRIMVGKGDVADPGKVSVYGDGLQTARTGEVAKFVVNTVNAGAGALAVTVEGPSKAKLDCQEVDEGYEFTYCPLACGDYLIWIRFAGVNIAGSPFKVFAEGSGQPSNATEQASVVVETITKTSTTTKFSGIQKFSSDASKCVAKGNGLTKAFRGKATSFTVDVTGAGNNILYVGMAGPKSPVDELTVKFVGNNQYTINYTVKQQGQYMLIVRWGEEDIPGSPFAVEVI